MYFLERELREGTVGYALNGGLVGCLMTLLKKEGSGLHEGGQRLSFGVSYLKAESC